MKEENCGFSCTYALTKVRKVFDELITFYDYYPEKAEEVRVELAKLFNDLNSAIEEKILENAKNQTPRYN